MSAPVRAAAKIVDLDEAARRVTEWRASGLVTVLANGVFDLLHVGHVRFLAGARAHGDRLIVAVNADAATAALKGPGRPVMAAGDRAALVAALRVVDLVVIFAAPTIDGLIEALAPDVHAKGTDYRVDTVPERETMRARGGATVITGDAKSHASRELVERIRARANEAS